MSGKKRSFDLLFINPWITDFAAFDFWSKPLGLLYLAAVARQAGARVCLIDCMHRFDTDLLRAMPGATKMSRNYGTGRYVRQIIEKPRAVADVPRYFARYGLPLELFAAKLRTLEPPAAVLMTSGMTYWYPGVQQAIALVRQHFPGTPIVLGGIYATLMPEHARKTSGADVVVSGEAENRLLPILADCCGWTGLSPLAFDHVDEMPMPEWELYDQLPYGVLMTSRGCPLRCSFCASNIVSGMFRQRSIDRVYAEICYLAGRRSLSDIAFYDDALLTNKRHHLLPLLLEMRKLGRAVRFHTPNGLQCKLIDEEVALAMRQAGLVTIRLSLESVSVERQKEMSGKVSAYTFSRAVAALRRAGFTSQHMDAYVMMALPGQTLSEVLQTMAFVHGHRVGVRLSAYSPIPGTRDYAAAVRMGMLSADADPLRTNNSIVPLRAPGLAYACYQRVALLAKTLNQHVLKTDQPLEDQGALYKRLSAQFARHELFAGARPKSVPAEESF